MLKKRSAVIFGVTFFWFMERLDVSDHYYLMRVLILLILVTTARNFLWREVAARVGVTGGCGSAITTQASLMFQKLAP
ncbi:MAG: hypothetical protein LBS31_00785 [Candidatus Adiutrix sp.]|jgi:hypothetical protein|nr:hypothetical protein [Candidatus Adiutrix sp.]